MRKDMIFGKSVAESLPQTTVSGGEFGNGVNTARTYAAKHTILAGAVTTAIVIKLQHSDTDGTYVDVDDAKVIGGVNSVSISASEDNTAVEICGVDLKLFQRLAIVSGAGAISATVTVADYLGE